MICKLHSVCLQMTGNGVFVLHSVCSCLWSYCWLLVCSSRKQKLKVISQNLNSSTEVQRITKSDCELNDFIIEVSKPILKPHLKNEHQKPGVKPRGVKIMSVKHTFRNQHRKVLHLNINLSKCRSSILLCTAAVNISHAKRRMYLTLSIKRFPILKESFDIISVLCNKIKGGEVCFHPLLGILYSHTVTLHIHSMNAFIMVCNCQNIYLINIIFKSPNLNVVFLCHSN